MPAPDARFAARLGSLVPLVQLVGLLGCSASPTHVAPPPAPDVQTFIAAHQSEPSTPWQFEVREAGQPWALEVPDTELIYLLGYRDRPDALGLVEPGPPACSLRTPSLVARFSEDDEVSSWRLEARAPSELLDALIGDSARCDPCATINMHALSAPHVGRFYGAGWLEDGVLLAMHLFGLDRVTRDGIEALPNCSDLFPFYTSMVSLGDDRFLIGGLRGELGTIHLENGGRDCVVETTTLTAPIDVMSPRFEVQAVAANPEDPSAFDYYALRTDGRLFHWSTAGLRLLGVQSLHPDLEDAAPALLSRLSSDHAITSVGGRELQHWRFGAPAETEVLPLRAVGVANKPTDRITAFHIDGRSGQTLAGTAQGEIWGRDPDRPIWSLVFQSPLRSEVGSIIELSERSLVTLDGGDAAVWHRGEEQCSRVQRFPTASNAGHCRRVLRRGDDIVLVDAIGTSDAFAGVVWIDP